MKKSLLALASGAFILGAAEFVMMGILPQAAAATGVDIPTAGHYISAYAIGVCFGTLILVFGRKVPPKDLIILFMVIALVGNLASAFSVNAAMLVVARFVAGLPHGAFFGTATLIAKTLAEEGKEAQAVSVMVTGQTVANMLGVPAGTLMAEFLSWRLAFGILAAWAAMTIVLASAWIPYVAPIKDAGIAGQLKFLTRRGPWVILAAVFTGNAGVFCWWSYVSPWLQKTGGWSSSLVPMLMMLAGFGMVIGGLLGGRLTDHWRHAGAAAIGQSISCLGLLLVLITPGNQPMTAVLTFWIAIGFFFTSAPQQLLMTEAGQGGGELIAGEVGYFTASIKNVKDTQVGDTVTGVERPAAEALPGYRPARAMVYCGIYTEDGSKYPDLRDALEKLQLNDASLSFEPESSAALGFGFRCGFLGMLHMEIIQERLEREFDLDLITTLPSVIYRITKTDGTVVMVDNPHNYPDPAVIELAEEPYAKVSIVSPPDYVGNIMPMCQERRGEFKDMQYLDTNLVELHYSMPLGEIIYDFFDTLKARTKGYASLDYELDKYEPSELVKVDMLLNGDQVDALSFIAHREKAYPRARRLCEKLRDNIPRQLFEVPVQAAIGGKVIARETVRAMRKDVLAKCYGGDITRKKKLLEKQKEGKKKMRSLGTVQIPTEAFMAVLKLDEE